MSAVAALKQEKQAMVARYARSCNWAGLGQCMTTLIPLAGLWVAAAMVVPTMPLMSVPILGLMTLFLVRSFVLMHECGHGSLFHAQALNQGFGFLFGVLSGMPQYVWSRHHNVHHATNGNWERYRGPLAILSVAEFDALSPSQQRDYVRARSIFLAPVAGLVYVLINPRLTWIKGTLQWLTHWARYTRRGGRTLRTHAAAFNSSYWDTPAEGRHMLLNNLVLLGAWVAMAWWLGPVLFGVLYVLSVSLAGAVGIVLFTVQHNFEHAYATGDEGWCYNRAAIHGTSFLVLPRVLRWFTANIGYHHVHHLSARIPNYQIADCHRSYSRLFKDVRRIGLADVRASLRYVLWDTERERLVSVAEARATRA